MTKWKSPEDRIKAPKGTKTIPITWNEYEKMDVIIYFRKWEAAEHIAKKGTGTIFSLPNGTYCVLK